MRTQSLIAFVAVSILLQCADHSIAQQYDLLYTAIVVGDEVEVHSGPGKSHYATHRLEQNSLVQVYREDPGGWCLIRPPEKSFSLIPASSVKMLSDDIAEITSDGVDAWVGTLLGPVEEGAMSQRTLKAGERVVVIDEVRWPNPGGKPIVWLQIEPPSGEYRWIHSSNIQIPPKKVPTKKTNSQEPDHYSEPPSFEADNHSQEQSQTPLNSKGDSRVVNFEEPVRSSSGWKSATRPFPETQTEKPPIYQSFPNTTTSEWAVDSQSNRQDAFRNDEVDDSRFGRWDGTPIDADRRPQRFASLESMGQQARSIVRDRATSPMRNPNALMNSATANSLIEIEEKLSAEMIKDPVNWNLVELKFEAERLRAKSDDPVERLALQHVLDKIGKCDELRKGYQRSSSSIRTSPNAGAASDFSTQYDASGWLRQTTNSRGNLNPSYVLQDDIGNITHHIQGTTGMNLSRNVDRRIGVFGRKGFNKISGLKHITAERIVVLR